MIFSWSSWITYFSDPGWTTWDSSLRCRLELKDWTSNMANKEAGTVPWFFGSLQLDIVGPFTKRKTKYFCDILSEEFCGNQIPQSWKLNFFRQCFSLSFSIQTWGKGLLYLLIVLSKFATSLQSLTTSAHYFGTKHTHFSIKMNCYYFPTWESNRVAPSIFSVKLRDHAKYIFRVKTRIPTSGCVSYCII